MSILFYFLVFENILERFIPIMKYSDEVLALFSLAVLIIYLPRVKLTWIHVGIISSIILTVLVGVISNFISGVWMPSIAIWKDILAINKFFLVYLFGSIVLQRGIPIRNFQRLVTFSRIYLVVLFFFGLLSQFVDLGMTREKRYFIKSFTFLYSHETFLVSVVVALLAILLVQGDQKNRPYIILGFIVLIFTMRSKAIVFMMVVVGLNIFLRKHSRYNRDLFFRHHKNKLYILVFIIFGITIFLLKDKLMLYLSFGITAARPALYFVGIEIVKDLFPFGTGLGTFASYLSTAYNSPVYAQYGIQNVTGLNIETNFVYVSDTYWPYIFGQFGALGALLYFTAILFVYKNCMRVIGKRKSGFITILATFSYILAACFAESLLTNGTCVVFGLLLGYYLNVNLDTRHGVVKHNE